MRHVPATAPPCIPFPRKGLLFLLALICSSSHAKDRSDDLYEAPTPITFESVRAWHARGGLAFHHLEREWRADLNGDGRDEVFLGLSAGSQGMFYALFAEQDGRWIVLGEDIYAIPNDIEIQESEGKPWRDFETSTPRSSIAWQVLTYSWDGDRYAEKSREEVQLELLEDEADVRDAETVPAKRE